jgi:hypothetical protein
MSLNEPGTYVKGDQARVCSTKADAVRAVFDGFKLYESTPEVEVPEGDAPDPTPTPDPDSALETSVDSNTLELDYDLNPRAF